MRHMRTFRWVPAAWLLSVVGALGQIQGLTIQSFNGAGQLAFNVDGSATNYCIEWASSPSGPWTNTWTHLLNLSVPITGVVTCSVPMFYRVVAAPKPYLVFDLSGGPSAQNYPVTYLDAVPPDGWTDEYKTTRLVLRHIPATTPNFAMAIGERTIPEQQVKSVCTR